MKIMLAKSILFGREGGQVRATKLPHTVEVALLISLFALLTSGCAIAPLTEEHRAQTLGQGQNEWALQAGTGTSLAYKRGITDHLDLGLIVEQQLPTTGTLTALTAKYKLLGSQAPLSLIANGGSGTGSTFGSIGLIQDLISSKVYALSVNARYNVFEWDLEESASEDAEDFLKDVIDGVIGDINGTYSYVSANVSNTIYFNSVVGITINLGGFMFLLEDEEDEDQKKAGEDKEEAKIVHNVGIKLHFKY